MLGILTFESQIESQYHVSLIYWMIDFITYKIA